MTLTQRQPSPRPASLSIEECDLSDHISEDDTPSVKTHPTVPSRTPVPYLKLFPLLVQRWSEGMTYAVIFPYINEMVHSMGVEETQVGVWSAIAESAMMATESVSAPFYGPLADRYGRRPVLIGLEILWGVFGLLFGFSRTVWTVIIFRMCLGMLAGCGVISRTMVGELCDKTNRIQGFAVFSPAFTIGMTTAQVSRLPRGFLAKPVPRLFPESWTLLVNLPYLLPAIAAALSAVIAAWLSILLLPETLDRVKYNESQQTKRETGGGSNMMGLIKHKLFQKVLTLYSLQNAIMFSFEAVFPLFGFTSKELGGLGLSTQELGIILGCSAGLSIFMIIFVFPPLHAILPGNRCLLVCLACYPLSTLVFPLMWYLSYTHQGPGMPTSLWIVMSVHMILRRAGDFTSTLLDTITLDAIPGPGYLASANSLGFSMSAVGRATGPFIVSYFFALSTRFPPPQHPIGGQIVWIVLVLLCVPAMGLAWVVGNADTSGEGHAGEGSMREEEEMELMGGERERTGV
ncbi:hypothetical protein I350_08329 [Cryptococcus amylolentus CBS 6273]|uniref:Major facilitator superfamily (MFS) profile domain-containing protein n=1 Tax=Cryptococcus amylolentus CBS 6273 TaxID=1296118 RepID=A0A1E3J626_9TREE|nr:hypothetical protein I350_08329 [Cryptococcus amylolentus CBS 6273]